MSSHPQKRNAFTAMMTAASTRTPNTNKPTDVEPTPKKHKPLLLLGLEPYITHPESQPPGTVLYHTPHFTAVHDAFPKSHLHFLLLPRSSSLTGLHPFAALRSSPKFLHSCKSEAEKLATICAEELARQFGDQGGRDWRKEVMVGVHANPSMANLHIHVMSREMGGRNMKKAGHYNSFTTRFFVGLDEIPEDEEGDRRRRREATDEWRRDLKCWRCGENFGRAFKKLKDHLEVEIEAWRKGDGPEWRGKAKADDGGEKKEKGEEKQKAEGEAKGEGWDGESAAAGKKEEARGKKKLQEPDEGSETE